MVVNEAFDNAARRLLGEEKWASVLSLGYSGPDISREISQDASQGLLKNSPTFEDDMAVMKYYTPPVSWQRRPRVFRVNSATKGDQQ